MEQKKKHLLLVDDTEMDRIILKAILDEEFTITETSNGYAAIEIITDNKEVIDAVLLDISMPIVSGFDVLRLMKENNLDDIPVFLITAEPTRENVLQAGQFGITEFIRKPFDSDEIIRRLKSKLGVVTEHELESNDIYETKKYISELEYVYKTYMANFGKSDKHYVNMAALMQILLNRYSILKPGAGLNKVKIELISKAAYFCDIGNMLIPDTFTMITSKTNYSSNKNINDLGASIIRLNHSKSCAYFVQICADMCMYHNERYDGSGFPNKIAGKNISVYNQMCRLVDEFDTLYSKLYGSNSSQVSFILKKILKDEGIVSPEVNALLEECTESILGYYSRL